MINELREMRIIVELVRIDGKKRSVCKIREEREREVRTRSTR